MDLLCATAKDRNIAIKCDKDDLPTGVSITQYMKDLGAGDRLFVVLSDKCWRSAYCMFGLGRSGATAASTRAAKAAGATRKTDRRKLRPLAGEGGRWWPDPASGCRGGKLERSLHVG